VTGRPPPSLTAIEAAGGWSGKGNRRPAHDERPFAASQRGRITELNERENKVPSLGPEKRFLAARIKELTG
jgi:hypothetical protein